MLKLSLLLSVAVCSLAHAQVIYQPVQFQYGSGNDTYYYGGSNPAVFAKAERTAAARQIRGVADSKPQVYSDAVSHQPNAYVYGVTAADARNQANASVPNYFRKGDLVGQTQPDGSIIVPATAGSETVIVRPVTKPLAPTTRPGVIIIIPKTTPATPKA